MEPPRPPRHPSRTDPRVDPLSTPPARPAPGARPPPLRRDGPAREPRYDTEPEGMPAMRARTPSGHDPIEDVFRRLGTVETRAGEIPGLRIRQDMFERELAGIQADVKEIKGDTGNEQVAAANYRAVIEEERRKRAEAEKALADKNAEAQRDKRVELLTRAIIATIALVVGVVLGMLGVKGVHLP